MSFSVAINIAQAAAPVVVMAISLAMFIIVYMDGALALDTACVLIVVVSRSTVFSSAFLHSSAENRHDWKEMPSPASVRVRTAENKFGVNVFLMFISIINLLLAAKQSVVCVDVIIHSQFHCIVFLLFFDRVVHLYAFR